ncbi:nucleotidyltransferase family protein [Candidatus Methylacidiphilum infernorum]|uniref:Nucleotidyltransferase n=1 Tax=Methylacidiphilum infernorum (isolate V4) TaxID=481448 RepID=B3DXH5_METI4|nr:nucleotidyltransferase domain-containing protein [Candidatus Methylacidiphilum infernorum]ACD82209.1 Nucleotidyltransferase [Methylacidiphilum infernorum V4]
MSHPTDSEPIEIILGKARQIIREEVERAGFQVRRALLFGSRARGECRPDSDWDFYIIIAPAAPRKTRWEIADRICDRLAEEQIWADVFVQSEETAIQRAGDTGSLTYYVLKEGIEL